MSKRVLCLDGGGIRGLILLSCLSEWEKDCEVKAIDMFDAFGCVSVGAIVTAAMLASHKSAQSMLDEMMDADVQHIFTRPHFRPFSWILPGPAYSGDGKRDEIRAWVPDIAMGELSKQLIIPTYDLTTGACKVYDSSLHPQARLQEVVDASSAAPTYFPPVWMKASASWEIDGGVYANNPSLVALQHVVPTSSDLSNISLVSLGTGHVTRRISGEAASSWGSLGWLTHNLIDVVMDAPMDMVTTQCKWLLGNRFNRVDPDLNSYHIGEVLDDTREKTRDTLVQIGKDMYRANKTIFEF
jgi:patatin-like phospholipase/acyl hydrolase